MRCFLVFCIVFQNLSHFLQIENTLKESFSAGDESKLAFSGPWLVQLVAFQAHFGRKKTFFSTYFPILFHMFFLFFLFFFGMMVSMKKEHRQYPTKEAITAIA